MYYDLLAKIKNGELAKKDRILVPFSRLDFAVAKILAEAGYLSGAQKKSVGRHNFIELKLAGTKNGPAVSGFKIVSKPGRRFYIDYRKLKPVKQGYGMAVLSTPKGIMNNRDARKNKVGGEYFFEIW